MRSFRAVTAVAVLAPLMTMIAAVQARADPGVPGRCPPDVNYTAKTRTAGFNGTTATSSQAAGPFTISYSEQDTASQTLGATAGVSVDAGVVIAKAGAKFDVSYAHTWTSTKSWTYSTTIPAGKTGLVALLHREDRVSFSRETTLANCSSTTVTFNTYLPLESKANADNCYMRDLQPYSYKNWRSHCTGD